MPGNMTIRIKLRNNTVVQILPGIREPVMVSPLRNPMAQPISCISSFDLSFLFIHRNACPVADLFTAAGQCVEHGGFSAVGISRKCDFHSILSLLPIANCYPQKSSGSHRNDFCQLTVYAVASILNGYRAAASAPGHHRDGLTAVAA